MQVTADKKRSLERNIVKYNWFKIFTKRVYLPLIAIQLVNVGHVTVGQLAVIAIAASLIQLILQLPTGYVADKWGNDKVLISGTAIAAISPLIYIFYPTFTGGLVAAMLFFGGTSFYSGALEAFMHDTLTSLKKEHQYAKIMGRAQSYGLLANIVLITAIPATYAIDESLPFILGFITLLINFIIALSFTYPAKSKTKVKQASPVRAFRSVVNRHNLAVFLFAGILFGVTHRAGEYRELVFQDAGIQVALFGALLAISSLLGAAYGFCLGIIDRLKPSTFYLLDFLYISLCLIAIGSSKNQIIIAAGFILFAAYDRVRLILIQSRLLKEVTHTYKATLLSALSVFSLVGEIAIVAMLARLIEGNGYTHGYLIFGFICLGGGFLLWLLTLLTLRNNEPVRA